MTEKTPIPTMYDVAKLARVSVATISRTLNYPERVSAVTRKKVIQAIEKLGYLPQPSQQLPLLSSTKNLLLFCTEHERFLFADMITVIHLIARKHHYNLLVMQPSPLFHEPLWHPLLSLLHHIDGIIQFGNLLNNNASLVPTHLLPNVVVNQFVADSLTTCFYIDYLTTTFRCVDYLYQLGHRRIACLLSQTLTSCYLSRKQGYIQALKRCGIAIEQSYLIDTDYDYQGGVAGFKKLMTLPLPPSAIICHTDMQAIGLLHSAKSLKIHIPDKLSVIGFGNISATRYTDPPLTTVAIPQQQIGALAIYNLLKQLQSVTENRQTCLLESKLIVRQTTAAL